MTCSIITRLRITTIWLFTIILWIAFQGGLIAVEPFRYPEDHYGRGQLKYINDIPVLSVKGTPEEMGEQIGRLALKPGRRVPEALRDYFKKQGLEKMLPIFTTLGKSLYSQFPDEYKSEIDSMIKAANVDRDMIILANTFLDLQNLMGCSSLLVAANRSTTGEPLFGRNLDFAPIDVIAESSLVIIYHPSGKSPYAIVTFPGLLATGNGMNESGLSLGTQSVEHAADGSDPFNPKGTAIVVALRRGFEDCRTVDDVDKWLRKHPLATKGAVAACDHNKQSIFEITTKTVAVREPVDGICCGTNHFRISGLATNTECSRYDALEKSRLDKQLSIDDIAHYMQAANAGAATIQTMIF